MNTRRSRILKKFGLKAAKLPGGSAHERTAHWIRRINRAYEDHGLDPTLYHVEALLTKPRIAYRETFRGSGEAQGFHTIPYAHIASCQISNDGP